MAPPHRHAHAHAHAPAPASGAAEGAERRGASRWRAVLASVGAFLAAFLAGSHHALHMMLLSVGLGGSALFLSPALRRGMLVVSLAMTLLSAWWLLRKPHRGAAETVAVFAALGASLVFILWGVAQHGW